MPAPLYYPGAVVEGLEGRKKKPSKLLPLPVCLFFCHLSLFIPRSVSMSALAGRAHIIDPIKPVGCLSALVQRGSVDLRGRLEEARWIHAHLPDFLLQRAVDSGRVC